MPSVKSWGVRMEYAMDISRSLPTQPVTVPIILNAVPKVNSTNVFMTAFAAVFANDSPPNEAVAQRGETIESNIISEQRTFVYLCCFLFFDVIFSNLKVM